MNIKLAASEGRNYFEEGWGLTLVYDKEIL